MKLFAPVAKDANLVVAAGSGTVARWAYTVPAGKRAVLTHGFVRINGNANAANTTQADIICSINGTTITALFINNSGGAADVAVSGRLEIDLEAGDSATGRSINTGAGGVTMQIRAVIREYT